jgi:hypothetical protein
MATETTIIDPAPHLELDDVDADVNVHQVLALHVVEPEKPANNRRS